MAVKLFKLILEFGRRFVNDSYQIAFYINMARVHRAEQEIDELTSEGTKFVKELSIITF